MLWSNATGATGLTVYFGIAKRGCNTKFSVLGVACFEVEEVVLFCAVDVVALETPKSAGAEEDIFCLFVKSNREERGTRGF